MWSVRGIPRRSNRRSVKDRMKKTLWIIYALTLLSILTFHVVSGRDRGPSYREASRVLESTADAVNVYSKSHGKLPESLSSIGTPEITAFRGIPIEYLPSPTNFSLSIDLPSHLSPFRNQKPPQDGDHLIGTKITMNFTLTRDTEPGN
jgi:hypothetical protein